MKTKTQPTSQQTNQRTFDGMLDRAPRSIRCDAQLASEPFVSPVANIPTNRTPLTPTTRPR